MSRKERSLSRLVVVSHKPCWRDEASPSGYATSGGFPFQMRALAGLFETTEVLVPIIDRPAGGGIPLTAPGLRIVPLRPPPGVGLWRKLAFPFWLLPHLWRLAARISRAELVHTPIPGDIGTIGLLLALLFRRPLFVRYCGNWAVQRTIAERFWRWLMESRAGGRNVMMATGGGSARPSPRNPHLTWIFSTSLSAAEIAACRMIRPAPSTNPRLITVARLEKSKGIDRLIRALQKLRRSFPGISLDVVGDGAQFAALRELAVRAGVGNQVRFHGQLDHLGVRQLLREADLFSLLSASEGFPKAVHEALAAGLPVVATSVSVLPQLVGNEAGRLVDLKATDDEIAAAIEFCLADQDRYAVLAATATARAADYSLERWQETIRKRLAESRIRIGHHRSTPVTAQR
ncbi:MAG: glycosyltransferase [Acidobacteriota bacterium]